MKVVVAIDSFKGSLTSIEAGNTVKQGIMQVYKDSEVEVLPLADGGEGTVQALLHSMNGEEKKVKVTGPLKDMEVIATYGILHNKNTAIIEMAQAAGLPIVPEDRRNPLNTTTYGVGEIIKDAINNGYRNFIIGIGGSATTDAGIGMLQALGFEFYNKHGKEVGSTGKDLIDIVSISNKNVMPQLKDCFFKVACDVNNPLYGINGAAYIYSKQKGATKEIVSQLDDGLKSFAYVVKDMFEKDTAKVAGAGAAGGLGYAFLTFLNTKLKSGSSIILEEVLLEEKIKNADFVITGEGKLDEQTAMGKAPLSVAKIAKKHNIKTLAFAGSVNENSIKCNENGIDAFFSIIPKPMKLEEAMDTNVAKKNMAMAVVQVFNLIKCLQGN